MVFRRMTVLSFLWSKVGAAVMAALAVLGLLFGVYRSGKKSAKVDGMQNQLENVKVRQDVENDIATSDRDDKLDRMQPYYRD